MNIHEATPGQMAQCMGGDATNAEGAAMRKLLIEAGYEDTVDVPEDDWFAALECAVVIAKEEAKS